MSSLNKVILIGYLGADPELRYTSQGTAVANFNIATSEKWTDKDGNKNERTEWHRITIWGKLAEVAKQHLAKGSQVYIEGRLQTRSWEDKEGKKRYTTEVVGFSLLFLGKPPETKPAPRQQELPMVPEPSFTAEWDSSPPEEEPF